MNYLISTKLNYNTVMTIYPSNRSHFSKIIENKSMHLDYIRENMQDTNFKYELKKETLAQEQHNNFIGTLTCRAICQLLNHVYFITGRRREHRESVVTAHMLTPRHYPFFHSSVSNRGSVLLSANEEELGGEPRDMEQLGATGVAVCVCAVASFGAMISTHSLNNELGSRSTYEWIVQQLVDVVEFF